MNVQVNEGKCRKVASMSRVDRPFLIAQTEWFS